MEKNAHLRVIGYTKNTLRTCIEQQKCQNINSLWNQNRYLILGKIYTRQKNKCKLSKQCKLLTSTILKHQCFQGITVG